VQAKNRFIEVEKMGS
jgi:hypothetical protein